MRLSSSRHLLLWFLSGAAVCANPPVVCRSFSVLGVECGGCVYLVEQALRETKGVTAVEVIQGLECHAKVTYSPVLVGEHKLAQSVRDATSLHGEPYKARLKLRVQNYTEHAEVVGTLFKRWKDAVRMDVLDPVKGELCISFLPLKCDPLTAGSTGWTLNLWAEAAGSQTPRAILWEVLEQ